MMIAPALCRSNFHILDERWRAMEEIKNTIDVFERLRKYQYKITVENGMEILLRFERERYHHLAGFQHLTDLPDVADPISKHKFYNDLRRGKISQEKIKKSELYGEIQERITFFDKLEEIMAPGEGRIIVEFDKNKTDTVIKAKFHLFQREGNPFKGEAVFFTLFIDTEYGDTYFPVTYVVEHSNMYMREQTLYDCTIERLPIGGKKSLLEV